MTNAEADWAKQRKAARDLSIDCHYDHCSLPFLIYFIPTIHYFYLHNLSVLTGLCDCFRYKQSVKFTIAVVGRQVNRRNIIGINVYFSQINHKIDTVTDSTTDSSQYRIFITR